MTGARRAKRREGSRAWLLILVAGVTLGIGIASFEPTRAAVQIVWSQVGVLRVESHGDAIRAAAVETGVDPNLIAAVMYAESRGQVDAVSSKGALGLLQLMEPSAGDAARKLGLPEPTREELLSDAALNTRLGAVHLAWLIDNEGPDLERVLCAYNAGRTTVQRWIRSYGSFDAWRKARLAEGGSEVLDYARAVIELRDRFAQRGHVAAAPPSEPPAEPPAPAEAQPASGLPAIEPQAIEPPERKLPESEPPEGESESSDASRGDS